MKRFLSFTIAFVIVFTACKSKQVTSVPNDQANNGSGTIGTVSHQFRASGCTTVILVYSANKEDTLILIPRLELNKYDVNGLKISFNYRKLRMPNPVGCTKGIPAEISNIKKK